MEGLVATFVRLAAVQFGFPDFSAAGVKER